MPTRRTRRRANTSISEGSEDDRGVTNALKRCRDVEKGRGMVAASGRRRSTYKGSTRAMHVCVASAGRSHPSIQACAIPSWRIHVSTRLWALRPAFLSFERPLGHQSAYLCYIHFHIRGQTVRVRRRRLFSVGGFSVPRALVAERRSSKTGDDERRR